MTGLRGFCKNDEWCMMINQPNYSCAIVDWQQHQAMICAIRRRVFIDEQGVSESEEFDRNDARYLHALARDAHGVGIATGRLMICAEPSGGQIGRMAVLAAWRGRGVGSAILNTLLAAAVQREVFAISLHAQVSAQSFYVAHGFVADGDVFIEANIKHIKMTRTLLPTAHEKKPS